MSSVMQEDVQLPADVQQFVDEWKDKPGNLIMVLHAVQEHYGYVPRQTAMKLAKELETPLAKIYGVISFYHYFKTTKPGRNKMAVCMGTACYLKGAKDIVEETENLLDIRVGETTEDGEFTMEAVRCVGCCGLAPVLTVNGEVYGKVDKDKLPDILAKHRNE
ncbi:MAG: NAD(P)H-dependent oxidoreductase subunit E [Spirochaetes bacterium]|nr:NAD(P)H-dependent oxidoreductase subunit E [Spirochaetota bacterium]